MKRLLLASGLLSAMLFVSCGDDSEEKHFVDSCSKAIVEAKNDIEKDINDLTGSNLQADRKALEEKIDQFAEAFKGQVCKLQTENESAEVEFSVDEFVKTSKSKLIPKVGGKK